MSKVSLNNLGQTLTDLAQNDLHIELEHVDSRGLYVNPHEDTITRKDVWKNLANRIIHSKKYTIFYTFVIVLSLITLATSFTTKCLSTTYLIMDYFINVVLIIEVILRINALGKNYWKSFLNILDLIIVPLCVVTLVYLTIDDCSNRQGKIADNIILGVRNTLQLFRLLLLIKNNDPFTTETEIVDFEGLENDDGRDLLVTQISENVTIDGGDNLDYLVEYEEFEKEIVL
ncbi:hypothetical protein BCR32DRAFT_242781 [Anaeromyces robustus]|uniref:Ion transport domain-containing protein n=1 Tax=Anaeromyces robustus TaxID=1754192 RepID=A0A1Y1XFI1_9FUNG|nr:hypothetical protein BCR32DRAFT_242781 [Anaeromyces robustus]|eukprot:ORX84166.1 hypothetical protein BCR32DRAFT_242781 [Anaeromyces robustus]